MLENLIEANKDKEELEHNHKAWLMWHGAILANWGMTKGKKKFPELKEFLSVNNNNNKKEVKGIDEQAIMAQLKAYQRRIEKKPK